MTAKRWNAAGVCRRTKASDGIGQIWYATGMDNPKPFLKYLKIIVYRLDEENHFRVYSFLDTVPVGISDGSCSVDFQDVFDEIQDLL